MYSCGVYTRPRAKERRQKKYKGDKKHDKEFVNQARSRRRSSEYKTKRERKWNRFVRRQQNAFNAASNQQIKGNGFVPGLQYG